MKETDPGTIQGSRWIPEGRPPNEGVEQCSGRYLGWISFVLHKKRNQFRKNKTKRYVNLLTEFRDHHQSLKRPRDYGDLQLRQESAGTLHEVQRGGCWEIQMQLKNPFIVQEG